MSIDYVNWIINMFGCFVAAAELPIQIRILMLPNNIFHNHFVKCFVKHCLKITLSFMFEYIHYQLWSKIETQLIIIDKFSVAHK